MVADVDGGAVVATGEVVDVGVGAESVSGLP